MTVQPGAQPTFYEQVGGHETFVRLVDVFYDGKEEMLLREPR